MYQSNFQKLLKANPNISKKATQPVAPTNPQTPKRTYTKTNGPKYASMSKKIDLTKVEQLRQLSQITSINESGVAPVSGIKRSRATAKILGDSGERADRSAPAKALVLRDFQTPEERLEEQRNTQQHTKQVLKQEAHIKNYIDTEWWYTTKNRFHVPPLHDPLVIAHHYALGPKHSTIFNMAAVDSDVQNDHEHQQILVRVVLVTKYGQVVYDRLVEPSEKVIDYRTAITGVSRKDFQIDYEKTKKLKKEASGGVFVNPKVSTLKEVRTQVAEIIDNRIVVGFLLAGCAALADLEKRALLHKFSTGSKKRNLTPAEQKELLEDYLVEKSLKNTNYLFDLLQINHPAHLTRDFAHGKIIPQDQFVINQFILPSLAGFIHVLQAKHGLTSSGASLSKRPAELTKGGLAKDNFLSLSRPLNFVSLDGLLNNAMAAYQLYLIVKNQWEPMMKQAYAAAMSGYRNKILELSKAIEDQKELDAIAKEEEDAKQKRRDAWNEKHGKGRSRAAAADDSDESDSDGSSDDDSDSDDGKSRW